MPRERCRARARNVDEPEDDHQDPEPVLPQRVQIERNHEQLAAIFKKSDSYPRRHGEGILGTGGPG